MDSIIKKLMKKSLSNDDISKLLDKKVKILTYPELANYKSIDELLHPYDKVVILYLTSENYGHWTCLFKIDDKNIEFFDPYAFKPDDELKMIPVHFRKSNGQYKSHLSHLLYKCNYIVNYNDFRIQKFVRDVNTCGRHCIVRLLFNKLMIDDYIKILKKSKLSPDYIVTYLTSFI